MGPLAWCVDLNCIVIYNEIYVYDPNESLLSYHNTKYLYEYTRFVKSKIIWNRLQYIFTKATLRLELKCKVYSNKCIFIVYVVIVGEIAHKIV